MSISTQCLECKHYTGFCTCEAFPEKIPQEIFNGTFDHINEYPNDNGIRFEPKNIEISKGEKTTKVKGHRTKTGYVKPHERKIKEGDNKKLVSQYLAGMDHASRHLKKEPEIAKLSEKELKEWQEWQQYYKDKLFRPSVSPHEDYYSQAILAGSSPQHVKALISKYQAKDPSSMGIDLVVDFEELYQRTKGDVPKKHEFHIDNLIEIKDLEESGIPGLVSGIHEGDTYICKFEESKAIHKVMDEIDIMGEVGTYKMAKLLNWDIVPETISGDLGKGKGSIQKFIPDSEQPTDDFIDGIDLTKKHLDDLSKIFILDMITGNNDRHSGNMIIDPKGKVWAIDNEGFGDDQQLYHSFKALNEWAKDGDGTDHTMYRVMENSFGDDQQLYQKFKDHVDENLIRVKNHQNKLIKYWKENDNINDELKEILENNINYLTKYYIDRWEINKSIKVILPFKNKKVNF